MSSTRYLTKNSLYLAEPVGRETIDDTGLQYANTQEGDDDDGGDDFRDASSEATYDDAEGEEIDVGIRNTTESLYGQREGFHYIGTTDTFKAFEGAPRGQRPSSDAPSATHQ